MMDVKAYARLDSGVKKYCAIMERLHRVDVSSDAAFQTMFNGFYRMRQRNSAYYQTFYEFLEANKSNQDITYRDILEHLYHQCGRIEASFSSKMLATIRPEMPIWDRLVLKNLGISPPAYTSKNRLEKTVACYQAICDWYSGDSHDSLIAEFSAAFPDVDISDTKKIDFILWKESD